MKGLLLRIFQMMLALCAVRAGAQMVVNDPPLTGVAYQQLARLTQLNAQLTQANNALAQLVRYTGDPRIAMARVEDLSSFVTNVGRMGGPSYKADTAAQQVKPSEALVRSANPYRRRLGNTVTVGETTHRRDPRPYEDDLRFEGSLVRARELLETNRAHQHTLLGRLSTANDHYERAGTLAELQSAALEIQRLEALMLGADALGANLHRDLELVHLEKAVAERDARRRRSEADRLLAGQALEDAGAERARLVQASRNALNPGRHTPARYKESGPWMHFGTP